MCKQKSPVVNWKAQRCSNDAMAKLKSKGSKLNEKNIKGLAAI